MSESHLTAESFELFLSWLSADREQAGLEHEAIRRRLIAFFDCRKCAASEDLADETINRVIRQIHSLTATFDGEPARYFYTIAHYVYLEYLKKQVKRDGGPVPETLAAAGEEKEKEVKFDCLDRCLQKLAPEDRELVIQYYQEDKQAKIDRRKALAEKFGYSPNALRIRMHRLRAELYGCVLDCLGRQDKR
ncbi:MAG: hypothetical protein JMDDDDMK_00418 [Acidobacteria bacterium]|nr:hypothetical protein [Acidobacteriota bacterium]